MKKKILPDIKDPRYPKLMIIVTIAPLIATILLHNISPILSWVCALLLCLIAIAFASRIVYEAIKQDRPNKTGQTKTNEAKGMGLSERIIYTVRSDKP